MCLPIIIFLFSFHLPDATNFASPCMLTSVCLCKALFGSFSVCVSGSDLFLFIIWVLFWQFELISCCWFTCRKEWNLQGSGLGVGMPSVARPHIGGLYSSPDVQSLWSYDWEKNIDMERVRGTYLIYQPSPVLKRNVGKKTASVFQRGELEYWTPCIFLLFFIKGDLLTPAS